MSRFINDETGVVVSVDDSKDDRFTSGWKPADEVKKTTSRAAKKSE